MSTEENRSEHDREFVLLIHGTNSQHISDTGTLWWQRESEFWRDLSAKLGPEFECQPVGQIFHWSGANSETHRRTAAEVLAKRLIQFENQKQPYHLIGHSHGGSVIWLAVRIVSESRKTLPNLQSWTTVGTPFLHYRPSPVSLWWISPAVGSLVCLGFVWSQVRMYVTVFGVAVRSPSGWPLSLLIVPMLWSIPLAVMVASLARLVILLYTVSRARVERAAGEQVYRALWERYLGLWCHVDEAIGGLASTLDSPGSVVPRLRAWGTSTWGRILSFVAAPVRALYNGVVALAGDEFIWHHVTRRLQGNDRLAYDLVRVTRGPLPFSPAWPELPETISNQLISTANDQAALTLAAVRNVLGLALESTSNRPSLVTGLTDKFTFRELVHNLYFANTDVRETLRLHVTSSRSRTHATASALQTWMQAGRASSGPDGSDSTTFAAESRSRRQVSLLLPAIQSGAVALGVAMAWLISFNVYQSSVYPYTDEYQINSIESRSRLDRVISGVDITDASLRRWASSSARAGFADEVLSTAARLGTRGASSGSVTVTTQGRDADGHDKGRLLVMAAVAHELLEAEQSAKADSILDDALALVRRNPPGINDAGFRAVAEELAHRGRGEDALFVVDRLSPDRNDWKAEGLGEVAEGYADGGRLDEAMVTMDRIGDLEQRAGAFQNFIRGQENNTRAKRRGLDALLSLAPAIPDVRNWRSGSLADVAKGLAGLGDTDRALQVARSIPEASFRAGALTSVAEALVGHGRVKEARLVVEEAISARSRASAGIAIVLAKIDRIAHDQEARRQASQILEQAGVAAPQEMFFPEIAVGAVATGWAELGDTRRCIEVLSTIPLGFYKGNVFEPFKAAVRQLVALGKAEDVSRLVHEMFQPTRKSYALIALALASEGATRRRLLGEAEKLTDSIPNDDDASFALSEIAIAWAQLHQYRFAVQLSDRTRAFDRLHVYSEILDHYLRMRGPADSLKEARTREAMAAQPDSRLDDPA